MSNNSTSKHRVSPDEPVFVISVAADLVGVHPQTLRSYERAGLVVPARTSGRIRRYSPNDIARLQRIQALTADGVSLPGVARVLELERRLAEVSQPSTALVRVAKPPRRSRNGAAGRRSQRGL